MDPKITAPETNLPTLTQQSSSVVTSLIIKIYIALGVIIAVGLLSTISWLLVSSNSKKNSESKAISDTAVSKTQELQTVKQTITNINKQLPTYDVYYLDGGDFFGANFDSNTPTKILTGKIPIDVSPLRDYVLAQDNAGDNKGKNLLYDTTGTKIELDSNYVPYKFSKDEKYLLMTKKITSAWSPNTPTPDPTAIIIWDLKQQKSVRNIPNTVFKGNTPIGILNDGSLLATDGYVNSPENITLLKMNDSEFRTIQNVTLNSEHPSICSDSQSLIYAGKDQDLHIVNLKSNEDKNYTNYNQGDNSQVREPFCSPDSTKVAFHTTLGKPGERIGILTISQNTIEYLDEATFKSFLGISGENLILGSLRLNGWDKTGENIIVTVPKLNLKEPNSNTGVAYFYLTYNLRTKKLTQINLPATAKSFFFTGGQYH